MNEPILPSILIIIPSEKKRDEILNKHKDGNYTNSIRNKKHNSNNPNGKQAIGEQSE